MEKVLRPQPLVLTESTQYCLHGGLVGLGDGDSSEKSVFSFQV